MRPSVENRPEDNRPARWCWRLPAEYLQGVDSTIALTPQTEVWSGARWSGGICCQLGDVTFQ